MTEQTVHHALVGTGGAERPVLEVKNLTTEFATPAGALTATDDVSFTLDRGKALGIVG